MSRVQHKRRSGKTSADVWTNQAAERGGLLLTFTKFLEKRGQKSYAQMWWIPSSCPCPAQSVNVPRPPFLCVVF